MSTKTKLGALVAAVALLLPLSACGGNPTSGGGTGDSSSPAIVIGSANFPENQLLGNMYYGAELQADGLIVEVISAFYIRIRTKHIVGHQPKRPVQLSPC